MGITKTLQFNQTLSVNKDDGGASIMMVEFLC